MAYDLTTKRRVIAWMQKYPLCDKTLLADRLGISRQSLHKWLNSSLDEPPKRKAVDLQKIRKHVQLYPKLTVRKRAYALDMPESTLYKVLKARMLDVPPDEYLDLSFLDRPPENKREWTHENVMELAGEYDLTKLHGDKIVTRKY